MIANAKSLFYSALYYAAVGLMVSVILGVGIFLVWFGRVQFVY